MSNAKVILVADDDENDVFFLRRGFERAGLLHTIIHVSDGQKVIQYLLGEGPYADRVPNPLPDLLLLDLKMPGTDGFDVLATLRALPQVQVPVIVFSTSGLMVDMQTAKKLGALDYMVKPIDLDGMTKMVLMLEQRWLATISTGRGDISASVSPQNGPPSRDQNF